VSAMEVRLGEIGRRIDEAESALSRIELHLEARGGRRGADADPETTAILRRADILSREIARFRGQIQDGVGECAQAAAEYVATVENRLGLLEAELAAAARRRAPEVAER
jgi:hypothetical protein